MYCYPKLNRKYFLCIFKDQTAYNEKPTESPNSPQPLLTRLLKRFKLLCNILTSWSQNQDKTKMDI